MEILENCTLAIDGIMRNVLLMCKMDRKLNEKEHFENLECV